MSEISTDSRYYLAVVNMAPLKPDADPRELANFKAAADPFMSRVQSSNPALRAFVDPRESNLGSGIFSDNETFTNLTVWETQQDLLLFLQEAHQTVFRRYRELFAPIGQAAVALWWTPAEHTPDFTEAEEHLLKLREVGPTEYAFDFTTAVNFPAPS